MIISLHHSVSVLVDWLISVPSVYYHYGREETDRVTLSASLLHTATSSLHCAVRPLFSPLSPLLCVLVLTLKTKHLQINLSGLSWTAKISFISRHHHHLTILLLHHHHHLFSLFLYP